ncbi:hypothetical protein LTR56_027557 [Elasticomyces elasticus]|nr:hypothetical protein LTR56_027557 [Elasticomyces elasticus]KAK5732764.1 hypothetical protein LTS12_027067 [Elasticomyces elasticus]
MESEPVLTTLCDSLERLVKEAHQSVCNDSVNVFDQARINSFLQRPRAADRPLVVKLQKSTWRSYTRIWKSLLALVYRTSRLSGQRTYRHQFTPQQIRHWDLRCLDLCISLLDHDLKEDLLESAVVGFFAVAGVDPAKEILREAYHFTPTLSGFIKIAQMLVIQKAVSAVQVGIAERPADLLDEMRARFLIHGTRSPFSWASRLRMYEKKVRDLTTRLGYISWSDDNQTVSYKAIQSPSMEVFREFVVKQMATAQE